MKVLTSKEAAALVQDGWTVAASGFGGFGHAEAITDAIERRFLAEKQPRDLTLLFAASNGDRRSRGMNHFGHEAMVKRVIAGGWRGTPRLSALALRNKIEAYNWPQGVICQLFRAIAAGQPGVITRTGLDTFVDPRLDGGRLNSATAKNLVSVLDVYGEEYLLYPAQHIDCALLRGTTADGRGNLTLEHEAFPQDMLAIAQAAKNCGGIVIAQVKRLAPSGTLDCNRVRVPGMLVDYVVVAESSDQHWMSFGEAHNPAYLGEGSIAPPKPAAGAALDVNRIIQRRAFLELRKVPGAIVNLGIGIPSGLAATAAECGYADLRLTIESGVIGGVAAEELSFGAASHPEAVVDQAAQFDFYSGGGLDIGFLGMLQMDVAGNVNVGRLKDQIIGVGGFIDIAQNAKAVCFLGAFSVAGLRVTAGDGKLHIAQEGAVRKIVQNVDQRCFGARHAVRHGRKVLYITERAVFGLSEKRLELLEIAPGIDLRRHVLDLLPEGIEVGREPKTMDPRIFQDAFDLGES
jgi:propionate CoA-transferase